MLVSNALEELITKLVLLVMVPTDKVPIVPPGEALVRKINEAVLTAVVEIVIVPAVIAADCPIERISSYGNTQFISGCSK